MNQKDIIIQILTIIDYQDDKAQFADQFASQCVRLTIMEAIDDLPTDKKGDLLRKIDEKMEVEHMRPILLEYISEVKLSEILTKTAEKQFEDYIETILPTLSSLQRSNLLDFLSKVGGKMIAQ